MADPNARFRRMLIACLAMALLLVTMSKRRILRERMRHGTPRLEVRDATGIPEQALAVAEERGDSVNWVLRLKPEYATAGGAIQSVERPQAALVADAG